MSTEFVVEFNPDYTVGDLVHHTRGGSLLKVEAIHPATGNVWLTPVDHAGKPQGGPMTYDGTKYEKYSPRFEVGWQYHILDFDNQPLSAVLTALYANDEVAFFQCVDHGETWYTYVHQEHRNKYVLIDSEGDQ